MSEKKMYRLIKGTHQGFYDGKMVKLIAGSKKDTGMFSDSFVKKFPGRFVEVEEEAAKENVNTGGGAVNASGADSVATAPDLPLSESHTIDLSMSEGKLLPLIEKATNPTLLNALFDEEEAGANRPKVKKALQARYTAIKPAKNQAEE